MCSRNGATNRPLRSYWCFFSYELSHVSIAFLRVESRLCIYLPFGDELSTDGLRADPLVCYFFTAAPTCIYMWQQTMPQRLPTFGGSCNRFRCSLFSCYHPYFGGNIRQGWARDHRLPNILSHVLTPAPPMGYCRSHSRAQKTYGKLDRILTKKIRCIFAHLCTDVHTPTDSFLTFN